MLKPYYFIGCKEDSDAVPVTVGNPPVCRPKRLVAIKTLHSNLGRPQEANLLTDIADVHKSATTFQDNDPKACVEAPSPLRSHLTPAASDPSPLSTPSDVAHRPSRWSTCPQLKQAASHQRQRRRGDSMAGDHRVVYSSISNISFATNGNQPSTEWKLKVPRLSRSLSSVCLLKRNGREVEREEERIFPIEKGS